MLERFVRFAVAILLISMALPACSMLTTRGRQQVAYERYVRKCSHKRDKQRAKLKTPRIPSSAPSEGKVTTEVGAPPESVNSDESQSTGEESN